MLACSFCTSVQAPDWIDWLGGSGPALAVAAAMVVGVAVGGVALVREPDVRRPSALAIGLGLAVVLPAAALVVAHGSTSIEVEAVGGARPMDGDHWRVRCEVFQAAPDPANALQVDHAQACSVATRPQRWSAYTLAATAIGLVAFGLGRWIRSGTPRSTPAAEPVPT